MTNEQVHGLDLISSALRLIGVLGLGDTAKGDQATQGLDRLKALEDMWRVDRLTMSQVVRSVQNLTNGVANYAIGIGATWNIDRPIWIEGAALLPTASSNSEIPIDVLTDQQYREFRDKGRSSAYPTSGLYFDKGWNTSGYGNVQMMETPGAAGLRVALYLPTSNVNIQNLSATLYLLPPGYRLALEYSLAQLLKDNYPGTWTQQLEDATTKFVSAIKRPNEQPGVLKGDPMFVRHPERSILAGD